MSPNSCGGPPEGHRARKAADWVEHRTAIFEHQPGRPTGPTCSWPPRLGPRGATSTWSFVEATRGRLGRRRDQRRGWRRGHRVRRPCQRQPTVRGSSAPVLLDGGCGSLPGALGVEVASVADPRPKLQGSGGFPAVGEAVEPLELVDRPLAHSSANPPRPSTQGSRSPVGSCLISDRRCGQRVADACADSDPEGELMVGGRIGSQAQPAVSVSDGRRRGRCGWARADGDTVRRAAHVGARGPYPWEGTETSVRSPISARSSAPTPIATSLSAA